MLNTFFSSGAIGALRFSPFGGIFCMVPNYKSTEDYKKAVVELTESERKVIDGLGLAKKTN